MVVFYQTRTLLPLQMHDSFVESSKQNLGQTLKMAMFPTSRIRVLHVSP